MWTPIGILLFCISLSTAGHLAVPFVDVKAIDANPCADVRNGQFVCKDCRTMAFCAQTENGWEAITVGTCSDSLFCDEDVNGCTYKAKCALANSAPRFQCQNPGTFPDPYDCRYYHVCSAANVNERKKCPSDKAYSPATKSCSLSSTDALCTKQQYECPKSGNWAAAWPTDANIYYLCRATLMAGELVMYPLLYRCPDGQIFSNSKCIASSAGAPSTPIAGATCASTMGTVADSSDCHAFFVCENGRVEHKTCSSGSYFDANGGTCAVGTC